MDEKLKAKKEKLELGFNKLREDNEQYYSRWYKSTSSTEEDNCTELTTKSDFESQPVLDT